MPFNGTGTYNLPGAALADGQTISATEHNALRNDMATALTNTVTRDGQSPATANLPMGGFKHSNVADGTALTEYATVKQVQTRGMNFLSSVSGTNTITGTVSPAPSAYQTGQTFSFLATGANTGAVTLNVNSLGAIAVKKAGTLDLVASDIPRAGALVQVQYDGTNFQLIGLNGIGVLPDTLRIDVASASTIDLSASAPSTRNIRITGTTTITGFTVASGLLYFVTFSGALTLTNNANIVTNTGANITTAAGDTCIIRSTAANTVEVLSYDKASAILANQIQPIVASVGSNALTVTLNPTALDFRSSTLTTGTPVTRNVSTAISLTVPSSATLGTVNAVQSDLYVLAIDNAGTVELAIVNASGGVDLSETGLITTTTISAGATSASTIYSTTGRTNVAYRVVGLVRSTQATAGTWASSPSLVQGAGGNALDAMQSFGFGQTWQYLTGSRAQATTYYNNTAKPIFLSIVVSLSGNTASLTVNGVTVAQTGNTSSGNSTLYSVVPPGGSYSQSGATSSTWFELR